MGNRVRSLLLIFINAVLLISTIRIVISGVMQSSGDFAGVGYFKAFTTDSNILMGIAAGIMLLFNIKNFVLKQNNIPKFVTILYFMGASAVALTFLTVLVFLAPTQISAGNNCMYLFSGQMLFFHVMNPLLAMFAFMFLINKNKLSTRQIFLGLVPTVVYSIVYTINVAILKIWFDFYGFTFGNKMNLIPIVIIVMYAVSFLLALLLAKIHNKRIKADDLQ